MHRKRKGMLIKNADPFPRSVALSTRTLILQPGEATPITSEEVMDPTLRDLLQTRDLAIVRPITDAEEAALLQTLRKSSRAKRTRTH